MQLLLATASNDAYMPLLRSLLASLKPFIMEPLFATVGCLDVGLNTENRIWLRAQNVHVVEPQWDLPVDPQLRRSSPHLRAQTARPFLREYFPGYDMYLWIDCDAWVQERFAVDWLLHAARDGTLAIVPEWDRAYRNNISLAWRIKQSTLYYDLDFVRTWLAESYFNAGVFALAADAPHWERWAIHFERGLNATQGKLVCDQTALNGALWSDALPVHPLPSLCNWLCHLAYPQVSPLDSKLCEPFTPRSTLGIVHLTGHTKQETILFNDTQGRLLRRNLRRSVETSA